MRVCGGPCATVRERHSFNTEQPFQSEDTVSSMLMPYRRGNLLLKVCTDHARCTSGISSPASPALYSSLSLKSGSAFRMFLRFNRFTWRGQKFSDGLRLDVEEGFGRDIGRR